MICRIAVFVLVALATTALHAQPTGDRGQAHIVVRVPADAVVFLNGNQTTSTGTERRFQTPGLEPGWSYYYTLKVIWQGKEFSRSVSVNPGETTSIVVGANDFASTAKGKTAPGDRPGFVVKKEDDRWWVLREGNQAAEWAKHGPPEKHVTRINVAPWNITLKAPDIATMEEYLSAKAGFVTKFEDGRLWVFQADAKEFTQFLKHGELAKQVVRPGAGPRGITLKAPDHDTILRYVAAQEGFETLLEDGRLWVFRSGSKEFAEFKKHHELEKHVTRINAGPLGMTLKAPDAATIDAYRKAWMD